jgi:hypothetical protein
MSLRRSPRGPRSSGVEAGSEWQPAPSLFDQIGLGVEVSSGATAKDHHAYDRHERNGDHDDDDPYSD